jgi:hypothetical protein
MSSADLKMYRSAGMPSSSQNTPVFALDVTSAIVTQLAEFRTRLVESWECFHRTAPGLYNLEAVDLYNL